MPRTPTLLAALLLASSLPAVARADNVFNVKDFGAKGDDATIDTAAIQAAIDACAKNGGTVLLDGGVFMSGMITLKSNVHLKIDANATLKGTHDESLYPDTNPPTDNSQLNNCRKTLVYAQGATNVKISGTGTIDGNGKKKDWLGSSKEHPERTRPMAIYIAQSSNVTIKDVTVKDAAMWAVVTLECDDVEIDHLNVHTPYGGTRDGIDLVDDHHAVVENCTIYSEDDSICLKSGAARGCEDITVRKNHVLQSSVANGLKLGTASRGGFKDVTFEDCVVENCDKAAMAVESVDGAAIQNIVFRRIQIHDAGTALFILLGRRSGPSVGTIDGVTFEDIEADKMKHSWGSVVSGTVLDGTTHYVKNVTLKNVHLTYKGKQTKVPADPPEYAGQYPDPNLWGTLPAAGIFFRHVDGLTLQGATVDVHGADVRKPIVESDVKDLVH
jgi:polygalacturonase